MTRIEIVIDDTKWPRLRMVTTRTDLRGSKDVKITEQQYDTAYTQFENGVHNALRPCVQELIDRRMKR